MTFLALLTLTLMAAFDPSSISLRWALLCWSCEAASKKAKPGTIFSSERSCEKSFENSEQTQLARGGE